MSKALTPLFRHAVVLMLVLFGVGVSATQANAYYSGKLTPGNPLAGHPWFVDTQRGSWWVAMRQDGAAANPLMRFANNPMGKTWGSWVTHPTAEVRDWIARAQQMQPGSIPFFNLARIEGQSCPYVQPPGFTETDVQGFVRQFSQGIGNSRVLVMVETDKLTVIRCLPKWAQARRFRELAFELHTLHQNNPNAIVYIDAGSEDWGKSPSLMAGWLKRADVAEAQGFMLGSSHHDWTYKEVRYGLRMSRLLGGKHFIVNTNSNGWGPKPRWYEAYYHGGCMPPGEGLGIQPTVKTPDRHLDAFLWSGTPGFEEGGCIGYGKNSPYQFYLSAALNLVRYANPAH
jgi:endoglucanase